jgi:hypothetical protein
MSVRAVCFSFSLRSELRGTNTLHLNALNSETYFGSQYIRYHGVSQVQYTFFRNRGNFPKNDIFLRVGEKWYPTVEKPPERFKNPAFLFSNFQFRFGRSTVPCLRRPAVTASCRLHVTGSNGQLGAWRWPCRGPKHKRLLARVLNAATRQAASAFG